MLVINSWIRVGLYRGMRYSNQTSHAFFVEAGNPNTDEHTRIIISREDAARVRNELTRYLKATAPKPARRRAS